MEWNKEELTGDLIYGTFTINMDTDNPMPQAGDILQIINVTPRTLVFWRGHDHVKASQTYEGFLKNATIEQIKKTFSIELTKDTERSDEGNEYYAVE